MLSQNPAVSHLVREDASEKHQTVSNDADVERIFQQIAQQQRRLNAMRERTAQEYPEFAGDILFL